MLKLLITIAILVFAAIGFYTIFPNAPTPDVPGASLINPGMETLLPADSGPFACTKMACECASGYSGQIECNSCSGKVDAESCSLKELVICENGKQVDTKYKVVSCEAA